MRVGIVKLYGNIDQWGDNSASCFSERFEKAAAENDEIHIHLHTYGGSVFEGNLIYNTIKNCKKPVDVYVDGVSASMGSVVMLAARKVFMAENAFIMIHAPSGIVAGTSRDMAAAAKCLKIIETNFKSVYAAKTGKKEEDVALWLNGDNWFGPKEALEEKLIDGIVGSVAKDVNIPKSELKGFTAQTLYQRYEASLNNINNKNEKNMKLIALALGLSENATENEILAEIQKVKDAQAQLSARDSEIAQLKTAAQESEKKTIETLVNEAIVAKKLTADQKAHFITVGEKMGVDGLKTTLASMNGATKPIDFISGASGGGSARTDKKWADLTDDERKDLRDNDRDTYIALFEKAYGCKPDIK